MKNPLKLVVIIAMSIFFASCTELKDEQQKMEDIYNVDRTKIVRPGDQGGN